MTPSYTLIVPLSIKGNLGFGYVTCYCPISGAYCCVKLDRICHQDNDDDNNNEMSIVNRSFIFCICLLLLLIATSQQEDGEAASGTCEADGTCQANGTASVPTRNKERDVTRNIRFFSNPSYCTSTDNSHHTDLYRHGGSAQAYKPQTPVSSTVCPKKIGEEVPYKASSWPFGRTR